METINYTLTINIYDLNENKTVAWETIQTIVKSFDVVYGKGAKSVDTIIKQFVKKETSKKNFYAVYEQEGVIGGAVKVIEK
jgi:hypothetical protein